MLRGLQHRVAVRYLSAVIVLILLLIPGYVKEAPVKSLPDDPAVQEFIRLINVNRRNMGCPELIWDVRLAAIATAHSADMRSRNFFGHTNPDEKGLPERLQEAKVTFSAAAENIALGPRTGQEAYDGWLRSPEHRRNMLDCRYTRHGVGRVGDCWTHVLLSP
jgi:uncharacterized protein YkwD